MVMRALGVALLVLIAVAMPAMAWPQARLGSDFADSYAEFAPLEALYRSFGDHLFAGTAVAVPVGLSRACARFLDALQVLHEEWIVQPPSQTVQGLGALVRLRVASEGFCSTFATTLAALDGTGSLPTDVETSLVAQGFFASIHDLNEGFENVLDAALRDAPEDEARWAMAVTFAVRSMLVNPSWVRVSTDVVAVFYGRSDIAASPPNVPDLIAQGFSASILDLNEQFESALHVVLRDGPADEERRAKAVTFAVRSMLVNPSWARIATDVAAVSYGRADATAPLFDVPAAVRMAMDRIVAAAGVDLTDEERADVRLAAAVVYDEFIAGG